MSSPQPRGAQPQFDLSADPPGRGTDCLRMGGKTSLYQCEQLPAPGVLREDHARAEPGEDVREIGRVRGAIARSEPILTKPGRPIVYCCRGWRRGAQEPAKRRPFQIPLASGGRHRAAGVCGVSVEVRRVPSATEARPRRASPAVVQRIVKNEEDSSPPSGEPLRKTAKSLRFAAVVLQ